MPPLRGYCLVLSYSFYQWSKTGPFHEYQSFSHELYN